jgi:hypothetical protein
VKCVFEHGWRNLSYVVVGVMEVLNFVCGHGGVAIATKWPHPPNL